MEIWKSIPDSTYEASSLGRIRSPRGYILKPYNHVLGYHIVTVALDGRSLTKTVHSLVAAAFHGPRPEGLDIAHGNCVKTDNRPSNLRYATRSDNLLDSHMMGHATTYPWRHIEVGETFETRTSRRKTVVGLIHAARQRTGRTFSIAANDNGSWTVTRVA